MLLLYDGMRLDVHSLPDDPTELKQIIAMLSSSYQDKVHHLEEQVRLLRNEIFGRKSEKRLPPQDERNSGSLMKPMAVARWPRKPALAEQTPILVAAHKRRKAGRKPLPADLPRIEVIHDIPNQRNSAPAQPLEPHREDVCEKLDIIPAKVQVIRHIGTNTPARAAKALRVTPDGAHCPLPPQLIPKTMQPPGF